ncbi:hypothetical protein PS6_006968 [Mucor atramentarius]
MLEELANIYRNTLQKYSWSSLKDYAGVEQEVGVKGIFVQVMNVKFSSTAKDPLYKLTVIDPTLESHEAYTCNFFVQDNNAPEPTVGDIVLLRDALVRKFEGRPQISKNGRTGVSLYNKCRNYFKSEFFVSHAEDEEIYAAFESWSQARYNMMNGFIEKSSPMLARGRAIITTDQIETCQAKYFNYVGMIVGFFDEKSGPRRREIKLTDYTKNPRPIPRLPDMADDGTIGNITNDMTLLCTLYERHANYGPFRFGDYVFLNNCARNTKNQMQLEIRISNNNDTKDYVKKLDIGDPRLQPLLKRRKEYEDSLHRSPSQIAETATNFMRSRVIDLRRQISIDQLLQKEEQGIEHIRVTFESQRPSDIKSWLKNYCMRCKKTSVPTIAEEPDPCNVCNSLMKPVYRAMFKVKDESGSELVVLASDEEASEMLTALFRLKSNPGLWGDFKKYIYYTQEDSDGQKPYFGLGVKKFYNNNSYYQDGWMYKIVNTEFILEDGSQ